MTDAEKIAALRLALQSLADEVAAIITFDGDASLQAKIVNARETLESTAK